MENSQNSPKMELSASDVEAFRKRMVVVRAIIDSIFGRATEATPELWHQGACMALIGSVVAILAARREEVSTQELVNLAKVLETSRSKRPGASESRSGTRNGQHEPEGASPPDGIRKLPPYFSDIVQQIYGTTLPRDEAAIPREADGDRAPASVT